VGAARDSGLHVLSYAHSAPERPAVRLRLPVVLDIDIATAKVGKLTERIRSKYRSDNGCTLSGDRGRSLGYDI